MHWENLDLLSRIVLGVAGIILGFALAWATSDWWNGIDEDDYA